MKQEDETCYLGIPNIKVILEAEVYFCILNTSVHRITLVSQLFSFFDLSLAPRNEPRVWIGPPSRFLPPVFPFRVRSSPLTKVLPS